MERKTEGLTNRDAPTEEEWNNLLEAFKSDFCPWGTSRVEKNANWSTLVWNMQTEPIKEFVCKLRSLGGTLGRMDEDI